MAKRNSKKSPDLRILFFFVVFGGIALIVFALDRSLPPRYGSKSFNVITPPWNHYEGKYFSVNYPYNYKYKTLFDTDAIFFDGSYENRDKETEIKISNPNGFYLDDKGEGYSVDKTTEASLDRMQGKEYEGQMKDEDGINRRFVAIISDSKKDSGIYWQVILFGKGNKLSNQEKEIFERMAITFKEKQN